MSQTLPRGSNLQEILAVMNLEPICSYTHPSPIFRFYSDGVWRIFSIISLMAEIKKFLPISAPK